MVIIVRMETMGSRLLSARKSKQLSQQAVADHFGVTRAAVSQWERDENVPDSSKIPLLAKFYGLKVETLWQGEEGDKNISTRSSGNVLKLFTSVQSETLPIDELDVRAAAGAGTIVEIPTKVAEWRLSRDLLRYATTAPVEKIKILTVIGDSMPGTFNPFDKIVVDTNDLLPSPPGVFVVWDGLGLVLKRIFYIADTDPPRIQIMSDNPKYPMYERTLEEAHIQGRVLGKWQWI